MKREKQRERDRLPNGSLCNDCNGQGCARPKLEAWNFIWAFTGTEEQISVTLLPLSLGASAGSWIINGAIGIGIDTLMGRYKNNHLTFVPSLSWIILLQNFLSVNEEYALKHFKTCQQQSIKIIILHIKDWVDQCYYVRCLPFYTFLFKV